MTEQLCVYCGVREGTTRDHVPPKLLFPRPRPSDLVTVPCCETCRRRQSLDDEYFARMVVMRRDVAADPATAPILAAVHRSFRKPQKKRFTYALLESMQDVPVYSPAGLYLGDTPTYKVDLQRLCRVIERTLRGLYFDEFKVRLADDQRCRVYALSGIRSNDPNLITKISGALDAATSGRGRVFGDKVFAYWVQRIEYPTPITL